MTNPLRLAVPTSRSAAAATAGAATSSTSLASSSKLRRVAAARKAESDAAAAAEHSRDLAVATRPRDLLAKYRRPPPASFVPSRVEAPKVHPELPLEPPPGPPPSDRAVEVAGVRVPPKPTVPGPEACCMSGCVHCVLTIYAEEREAYDSAVARARAALEKQGVPRSEWPGEVSDDKDGEEDKAPDVDPTMAAFLALEASLKKK